MDRRHFLTAAAATAATAATLNVASAKDEGPYGETAPALKPTEPLPLGPVAPLRYPDPHIESLDKRFQGSVGTGHLERIATGFRWVEGPCYVPAWRCLVFSDIPNNRMMRILEDDNHCSVFRYPSLNSNGNALDPQGRLVTAEHTGRRITRTEFNGDITVIADSYNGKKLNSPNDVVCASNGTIWFTDPTYGVRGWYESLHGDIEQDKHNVYFVSPQGEIKVVADDFVQPNGICFSPDEKKLYVIDSGISEGPGNPAWIRVFDVDIEKGTVSNGKVFAKDFAPSLTDGMRADVDGNIWCSVGWGDPKEDGVRCYSPEGQLLGKIHTPETTSNVSFGGLQRNRLYIGGTSSVYAIFVNTQGAGLPAITKRTSYTY